MIFSKVRRLLAVAVAIALGGGGGLVVAPASVQAQPYPTKPIRIVVPLSAGSATDIIPRLIFDHVGQSIGQNFIIENRVGAGGSIAANTVAKADPDGYTLLVHSNGHVIAPAVTAKLPYDVLTDFTNITSLGIVPHVLVIAAEKKVNSIKELVGMVKKTPGGLVYGAVVGTAPHLNAEHFRKVMNIEGRMVPYKGAPEALTEVLAARIDVYFSPILPAMPFLEDNKMVALAVTAAKRVSALPNVPTAIESGYPDSVFGLWIGLYGPAKLPAEVVAKLYAEVHKALAKPDVQDRLKKMGVEPNPMTPAEFDTYVRKEVEVSADLAKVAGLSKN
jgi:tripartite-type tricarboxylate transporter receptor subunit TctC